MELASLVLSIIACAGLAVAGLFWRSFAPAYFGEKAKNLASKEDLAHLTGLVESVKATHAAEIERLKSSLAADAQITERRRRVYEELCGAIRVFIEGHGNSNESKDRFHVAYASAWLWASDEALSALNRFISLQRQRYSEPASVSQDQLKLAYVSAIIAMRRDAGFASTTAQFDSYQFVQFV